MDLVKFLIDNWFLVLFAVYLWQVVRKIQRRARAEAAARAQRVEAVRVAGATETPTAEDRRQEVAPEPELAPGGEFREPLADEEERDQRARAAAFAFGADEEVRRAAFAFLNQEEERRAAFAFVNAEREAAPVAAPPPAPPVPPTIAADFLQQIYLPVEQVYGYLEAGVVGAPATAPSGPPPDWRRALVLAEALAPCKALRRR